MHLGWYSRAHVAHYTPVLVNLSANTRMSTFEFDRTFSHRITDPWEPRLKSHAPYTCRTFFLSSHCTTSYTRFLLKYGDLKITRMAHVHYATLPRKLVYAILTFEVTYRPLNIFGTRLGITIWVVIGWTEMRFSWLWHRHMEEHFKIGDGIRSLGNHATKSYN